MVEIDQDRLLVMRAQVLHAGLFDFPHRQAVRPVDFGRDTLADCRAVAVPQAYLQAAKQALERGRIPAVAVFFTRQHRDILGPDELARITVACKRFLFLDRLLQHRQAGLCADIVGALSSIFPRRGAVCMARHIVHHR